MFFLLPGTSRATWFHIAVKITAPKPYVSKQGNPFIFSYYTSSQLHRTAGAVPFSTIKKRGGGNLWLPMMSHHNSLSCASMAHEHLKIVNKLIIRVEVLNGGREFKFLLYFWLPTFRFPRRWGRRSWINRKLGWWQHNKIGIEAGWTLGLSTQRTLYSFSLFPSTHCDYLSFTYCGRNYTL